MRNIRIIKNYFKTIINLEINFIITLRFWFTLFLVQIYKAINVINIAG